jgi:hypothetical protein
LLYHLELVMVPRRHFFTFINFSVVSREDLLPFVKHTLHYRLVAVVAVELTENHRSLRTILM